MPTKKELEEQIMKVMQQPMIEEFYKKYMENYSQGDTIITLEAGIKNGMITSEQALMIALLVGIEWREHF